ncbi:MAG TPA: HEPN domain-containing protein [Syntrophaceae bacterium]|nr:HEPN domain-containing protein [Syntrophaceae bacterium]
MKLNKEDALRWLAQAEHNLEVAEHNLRAKFYSDTCFMAEQATQVGLKAFIIYHKKRLIWEHSIQELARLCSQYHNSFEIFIEYGKILDRYYIPTRYPNALARPAVPYKTYTEKDARDAIQFAREIVKMVKEKISGGKQ